MGPEGRLIVKLLRGHVLSAVICSLSASLSETEIKRRSLLRSSVALICSRVLPIGKSSEARCLTMLL